MTVVAFEIEEHFPKLDGPMKQIPHKTQNIVRQYGRQGTAVLLASLVVLMSTSNALAIWPWSSDKSEKETIHQPAAKPKRVRSFQDIYNAKAPGSETPGSETPAKPATSPVEIAPREVKTVSNEVSATEAKKPNSFPAAKPAKTPAAMVPAAMVPAAPQPTAAPAPRQAAAAKLEAPRTAAPMIVEETQVALPAPKIEIEEVDLELEEEPFAETEIDPAFAGSPLPAPAALEAPSIPPALEAPPLGWQPVPVTLEEESTNSVAMDEQATDLEEVDSTVQGTPIQLDAQVDAQPIVVETKPTPKAPRHIPGGDKPVVVHPVDNASDYRQFLAQVKAQKEAEENGAAAVPISLRMTNAIDDGDAFTPQVPPLLDETDVEAQQAAQDALPKERVPGNNQYLIFHNDDKPLGFVGQDITRPVDLDPSGSDFFPIYDRFRLGFPAWERYYSSYGNWWDPYHTNVIKGDYPFIPGDNKFFELTAVFDTQGQARRRAVNAAGNGGNGTLDDTQFVHRFFLTTDYFQEDNTFTPSPWFFRLTQAIDFRDNNQAGDAHNEEYGIQEAFVDLQLAVLSDYFDTLDLRIGRQVFNTDFRGFLYNDADDMVRLFWNYAANRWQYNVVYVDAKQRDAVSNFKVGFEDRQQQILIVDVTRQDSPVPGFFWHAAFAYNNDQRGVDQFGVNQQDLNAGYVTVAGEGVINTFDISAAFIQAFGYDDNNPVAGRGQNINAQFAALEITRPTDWYVPRVSIMYASGDSDPTNGTAGGFDAILDNPLFAGANFNTWNREAHVSSQGGFRMVSQNSFLPNLRDNRFNPSNFVNPGLLMATAGVDAVLTAKTVAFVNYNYMRFVAPAAIEQAIVVAGGAPTDVDSDLGHDLTMGIVYKPYIIDNVTFTFGGSMMVQGEGMKDLTGESDNLYTTFMAYTFIY